MSTTAFLSNDSLWREIGKRVKSAKRVYAAVAFLGSGGADILPLKKGDVLVVNMGPATVKQGITSPKEIERLITRGVTVYSRSNLHAKFFICDRSLIVGSANISQRAQSHWDEAATVTTDPQAILRAKQFFDQLCTEPVRPEYLNKCLEMYRPPKFEGKGAAAVGSKQGRVIEAKLWFIGGLSIVDFSEDEEKRIATVHKKVEKRLRDPEKTHVNSIRYTVKPKYVDSIRIGDWIIGCFHNKDGKYDVYAPVQVIGGETYSRDDGKSSYLLLYEEPRSLLEMTLNEFRRKVRKLVPSLDTDRPRTKAIEDRGTADDIIRLFTPRGHIAKVRRAK